MAPRSTEADTDSFFGAVQAAGLPQIAAETATSLAVRKWASNDSRMLLEFSVMLGLVTVNGLLAGAEIAIVSVNRSRLKQLDQARSGRARAVQSLRDSPESFFATVQIGITVIGATAGALGGASFAEELTPIVARLPLLAPHAHAIALALVITVLSVLSLVIGELVPKSIALRHAESYSLLVGPPILWLSKVARPLVWFLTLCSNALLALFGDRATFSESRTSARELRDLVDEAAQAGALHPTAGEIAARALEFEELTAADVMVPRTRIVAIDAEATAEEVKTLTLDYAYSRFPVHRGQLDEIVGYVLVKDVLAMAWEGRLIVLGDMIRPPYFVAETAKAASVLKHMQERRIQLAIVVDEHGGTAGLITIEDLVEELVGDIFSEVVHSELEPPRRLPDGSFMVSGDAPLREVNRGLSLALPEGTQWSTVGGLSAALAGRVPRVGDVLASPDGTRLRVEAASARQATRVRIWPPSEAEQEPAEPEKPKSGIHE